MRFCVFTILVVCSVFGSLYGKTTPVPAPVDDYKIHSDGGLIYNPLEREALKTGQLKNYSDKTNFTQFELSNDEGFLKVSLPAKNVNEYDVIPIDYSIKSKNAKFSKVIAVEATAFEDASRRKSQDLFDLALPGIIDFEVEFLGTITAHQKDVVHHMEPNFSDEIREFPSFVREPFVRSGVVEAGDLVWFKFKYTNTGNTIVDPEGLGAIILIPKLLRKAEDGTYKEVGGAYSVYVRDPNYVYPGESSELWIHCTGSSPPYAEQNNGTPQGFGIVPGEYLFQFNVTFRDYRYTDNIVQNLSDGTLVYKWEMPFVFEDKPRQIPVPAGVKQLSDNISNNKITDFIHTFQEFMTTFDCHLKASDVDEIKGTLYLQVAPWTKNVVVKFLTTNPTEIKTVSIPVEVLCNDKVAYQNFPHASIIKDNLREPMIFTQSMVEARSGVQIGPFVEKHVPAILQEMTDCGANVIGTMSMPWLYSDRNKPKSNYQGDGLKYVLDLARAKNIAIEGAGAYPFDRGSLVAEVSWMRGKTVENIDLVSSGYPAISLVDPALPRLQADVILYQFKRWGDVYYQLENGDVPIGIEDTRGWMRVDINIRYPMGESFVKSFQEWLKQKYGTISAVNSAWNSNYKLFEDINPEAGQYTNSFGHKYEYMDPNNTFHDWSPAVFDLDDYRTEVRVKNYREVLALLRPEIPNVCFALRTEGANFLVSGIDPESPNPHFRHIYYSQRRCGLEASILQKANVVKLHGDYITIPYTPSELRWLVRNAVEQGIIPMHLPQFDNMRDIAVNDRYGTDYQIHYNISSPKKGYMMHSLVALYPWFKATYEEGGVPGVLWEDFQCDGFVTETQKREMKIFKAKLQSSMSGEAADISRRSNIQRPNDDWRKNSKAKKSYIIQ